MSAVRRSFGLLLLTSLVAGCGDDLDVQLVPVEGRVTIDGKPLTKGVVSMRPGQGNPLLHHPTGSIDAQGTFKLSTVGREGAPPGKYKVLVFADGNVQDGKAAHPTMPKWLVAERYTSEQTTDLTLEVAEGESKPGQYDLKLKK